MNRVPINREVDKKSGGVFIWWNITQQQKQWNLTIFDSVDGLREYYAKWNTSDK